MSFGMKKRICIFLILLLLFGGVISIFCFHKKQPQGEYITKEEIETLNSLLEAVLEAQTEESQEIFEKQKEMVSGLKEITGQWEEKAYVTYQQFNQWEKEASAQADVLTREEREALDDKYRKTFFITKEDWYPYFEKVCGVLDTKEQVTTEELLILGDSSNVTDIEGNPMEENQVFTQNGRWEKKLAPVFIKMQQKASYITFQGALWGVHHVQEEAVISNVWLTDNTQEEILCFYKNYQVLLEKNEFENEVREQVADIYFSKGNIRDIHIKNEKITGKVLAISSDMAEIEGEGSYPLSDNIQYYRLYDRLENVGRSEVPLGYDFTDFVVEDGKIQAALLVRDEKMDHIRVLIKNTNFEGYFHEKIEGKADVDMELVCGTDIYEIEAGEIFSITPDSEYFESNRIYLKPKALTGRTIFTSIERNNAGQGYYGNFELVKREEGILLINEVLLEEYLYAVVPSEMPAYYPMEALKAQAISARTYAYDKMVHSKLSSYGANLDDSATYQVYNNIKENVNTTTAVKETRGKLLYAQNNLAGTYYYSTSCGFGTDAAIWNANNVNTLPYLKAKEMTLEEPSYTIEDMRKEAIFTEFITKKNSSHFEAEESWYRWNYAHSHMDVIAEKLRKRLENYPQYVSASKDGSVWGKEAFEEGFVITDIQVQKRGAGGTIEELLVTTDKGYFLVKNEYHVRAVLTDGESIVQLQNENTYACGNLLPSAFFVIEPEYENNKVTAIRLTGGGFGHGVGMSQNGAKNLADRGYMAEEILGFYYEGCQIRQ